MNGVTSSLSKRMERSHWHAFGLGKLTSAQDVSGVRNWLKQNCGGEYSIRAIKDTIGNRRVTVATFVRIKDEVDAVMFRLNYAGME